jgi:antitoxin (DNA-binding transcriptional repressor) of toxin-antitoxin stability system|tara:strand:+ start:2117 stop:2299 length:183 start_codon:yes stop_codon:yes gene_type:complete
MSIEIFTVQEWEERFDELFARVENGETIGVINDNDQVAVMMPADEVEEMTKLYTEHDEAS